MKNAEHQLIKKIQYIADVLYEKSEDDADYTAQASYCELTAELFGIVISGIRILSFLCFGLLATELVTLVLILQ